MMEALWRSWWVFFVFLCFFESFLIAFTDFSKVFEATNILSSLELQSIFLKWSHRVEAIKLSNYEREPLIVTPSFANASTSTSTSTSTSEKRHRHRHRPTPPNVDEGWRLGKTLGVVVSSGDHVTKDILPYDGTFNR